MINNINKNNISRFLSVLFLSLVFILLATTTLMAASSSTNHKKNRAGNVGKKDLKELYNTNNSRAAMVTYSPDPTLTVSGSQTTMGVLSTYLKNKYTTYNADSIEIDGVTVTGEQLYAMVEAAMWLAMNSGDDLEGALCSMYDKGMVTEEMLSGDSSDQQCDSWECEDKKNGAQSETTRNAILAIVRNAIRQSNEEERKDDEEKYSEGMGNGVHGAYIVVSGKNKTGGKQVLSVLEAKSVDKAKEDGETPSEGLKDSVKKGTEEARKKDEESKEDKASIAAGESQLKSASLSKTEAKKKDKYAKDTEYETKDTKPILVPVTEQEYREYTAKGARGKAVGDQYYLYAKLPVDKLAGEAREKNADGTPASMGITEAVVEGMLVMVDESDGEGKGEGKERGEKKSSTPLSIRIALKSLKEKKEAQQAASSAQARKENVATPPSATSAAKAAKKASASGPASETVAGATATGVAIARGGTGAKEAASSQESSKRGNVTRQGSKADMETAARNGTLVSSKRNADGSYTYTQQVSNPQDFTVTSTSKGTYDDVVAAGRRGTLVTYQRNSDGTYTYGEHTTRVTSFVTAGTRSGEAASMGVASSASTGASIARSGANPTSTRQGVSEEEYQALKDTGKLAGAVQMADGTYNIIERSRSSATAIDRTHTINNPSSQQMAEAIKEGTYRGAVTAADGSTNMLVSDYKRPTSQVATVVGASDEQVAAAKTSGTYRGAMTNADGSKNMMVSSYSRPVSRDNVNTAASADDVAAAQRAGTFAGSVNNADGTYTLRTTAVPNRAPFDPSAPPKGIGVGQQAFYASGTTRREGLSQEEFDVLNDQGRVSASMPQADGTITALVTNAPSAGRVASQSANTLTQYSYQGTQSDANAAAKRGTLVSANTNDAGGLSITEDMSREKGIPRTAVAAARGPAQFITNTASSDDVAAAQRAGTFAGSVNNADGTYTLRTTAVPNRAPFDPSAPPKGIGVGQDAFYAAGTSKKEGLTQDEYTELNKQGRIISSIPQSDGTVTALVSSAPSSGRMPREPRGISTGEQVAQIQTSSPTRFTYRGSREDAGAAAKRGTLVAAQGDNSGGLLITEDMSREKQVANNQLTSTGPAVAAATPARTVIINRSTPYSGRAVSTVSTPSSQVVAITGVPPDKNINLRASYSDVVAAKKDGSYIDAVKNYDGSYSLTTKNRYGNRI